MTASEPVDTDAVNAAPARRLRPVLASQVRTRRVQWLWHLRIVLAGMTLLAGREGLGKSTVAVALAARVTRGELEGAYYGQPRTVIYIHSEDARDYTVVPRLIAAGADLDRVVFLDAISADDTESAVVLPLDTELIADVIEHHKAALVILDAATSVIDSRFDGDKDRQMRQGLERIAKLAERTGAAVLGIVHFGKRESNDTGKLILGSIAWSQVARSVLAVARDDAGDQLVITATKANLGPGAPSQAVRIVPATVTTDEGDANVGHAQWLGDTDRDARELLGDAASDEDPSDRTYAEGWLDDYLTQEGRALSKDVKNAARKADISERTLQRARQQLRVVVESEGFPRVSYWRLPDQDSGASGAAVDARACTAGTTGTTGDDLHKYSALIGTTGPVVPVVPAHVHEAPHGTTGTNGRWLAG